MLTTLDDVFPDASDKEEIVCIVVLAFYWKSYYDMLLSLCEGLRGCRDG